VGRANTCVRRWREPLLLCQLPPNGEPMVSNSRKYDCVCTLWFLESASPPVYESKKSRVKCSLSCIC
jgi:hypothetical protein